jgi:transposase
LAYSQKYSQGFFAKKYSEPDLRGLERISIDEISIGKGHNYLTVVINADTGQPLYVAKGKGESALDEFWKLLGPRRAKRIKAVAIDMGKAYIAAVKKHIPKAKIVFDHFHVVKLVNDTLDQLRRKIMANSSAEDQLIIKGSKYLLLSNEEELNDEKKNRLQRLLDLNTILTAAYILKEDLRQIWSKKTRHQAEKALDIWLKTARSTQEPLLIKLAKTIESHMEGILNWYEHPINSGRIEGLNNKIKTMMRQAYGYRDQEFLKLLILAILRSRTRMVIDHSTQ